MEPEDEGSRRFQEMLDGAVGPRAKFVAQKTRHLRQQERLLLAKAERTDTFVPGSNNHLLEALTSEYFRVRVNAGINRLRLHRAESGIVILTNGVEVVFSSINLGVPDPENLQDIALFGVDTGAVDQFPSPSAKWRRTHNEEDYSVMADFHFHPSESGFSNKDIESYDDNVIDVRPPWKYKRDSACGLFVPVWNYQQASESGAPTFEQGVGLTALRLLMFSGPPTGTEYQADTFQRLTLDRQADVLRESGMRVTLVDLPIMNDTVDLTPLGDALK